MAKRGIHRLALEMRKSHRRTKSWRTTSRECKVFTEDGRVNPGLAKRIALERYIPSDEVIKRLIQHGAIEGKKKKAQQYKDLFDMPVETLLYKLTHREPMPPLTQQREREIKKMCRVQRVGAR
jgi:hypothetical protein